MEEGWKLWEEALARSRDLDPFTELALLHNLGILFFLVFGDLDRAHEHFQKTREHPLYHEDPFIPRVTSIYTALLDRIRGREGEISSELLSWLRGQRSVLAHSAVAWVMGIPMPHALLFPHPLTPKTWETFLERLLQQQSRLLRIALWKALKKGDAPPRQLEEIYIRVLREGGFPDVYLTDIPFRVNREPEAFSTNTP